MKAVSTMVLAGGLLGFSLLLFRSCDAPEQSVQPQQQQYAATEATVEEPQPQGRPDQAVAQRNELTDRSVRLSEGLVGDLICTRKEQFLLEARDAQQRGVTTAEEWMLGKIKQIQANALRASSQHGTFTGTAVEASVAAPLVLDGYAASLAYQEITAGDVAIVGCNVNMADQLLTTNQLVELATAIEQASPEQTLIQLETENGEGEAVGSDRNTRIADQRSGDGWFGD